MVVAVCLLFSADRVAVARGDGTAVAARLLQQAQTRLTVADFAAALSLLDRARQGLAGSSTARAATLAARIELQRGVVLAILGKEQAARRAFVAAVRGDPAVDLEPSQAKASIIALFRQVRAGLWGELEVVADLPEVSIWIDGRPVGMAPARARLQAGAHEVRAAVLGRQVDVRQVLVPAERAVRLQLELRSRCGTLVVDRAGSRPRVLLDGYLLGRAPLRRVVPPGEHDLELRSEGRRARARVEIRAGRVVRVSLSGAGLQVAAGGPDRSGAAADGPIGRSPSDGWIRGREWTWVALGGSALSLAVAFGLGAAALSDFDDYQTLPADQRSLGQQLESRIRSKATAANAMYGVAGGLLVTSAVLYLIEGKRARGSARVTLWPAVGVLKGAVAVLRF